MKDFSKLSKDELIVELTFINKAYEIVIEENKKLTKQLLIPRVVESACICDDVASGKISSGYCHKHKQDSF